MWSSDPTSPGRARRGIRPAVASLALVALTLTFEAFDTPHSAKPAGENNGWVRASKQVAMGDLDGDGDLDMVAVPPIYLDSVWVLWNDGGNFTSTKYPMPDRQTAVALATWTRTGISTSS